MTAEALHAAHRRGKVPSPPAPVHCRRPHLRETAHAGQAIPMQANPLLVEVTRGDTVESRHRGAFAVVDTDGRVVLAAGDIEAGVFPRSAIKPRQTLALFESGAAAAYELGDREITLASGSHNGETVHVDTVEAWLARIGCTGGDLECGAHLPYDAESGHELLRAGGEPRRAHNNCSGKHAGFLTVARHLDHPTKGYIQYTHPVQQRVLGILEQMTGLDDLGAQPRGIDGCGIPTIAVPLGNLALAMARFAAPDDQPTARQAACARIRRAMAAEPYMVAGRDRFCTDVMQVTGERALMKTGAEGVYCAAFPELGLGLALKIDDGAGRAAEVALGRLLRRLDIFRGGEAHRLADALAPPIVNRAGERVGVVRASADFPA
jgi:L-asparaginase II